jgi:hypothetical protein
MTVYDDLAQDLYNLLQPIAPASRQRNDLMDRLGMIDDPSGVPTGQEVRDFHIVKGKLQDLLGVTDTVTLIGEPTWGVGGWMYSLRGDPTDNEARDYLIAKTSGLFQRQKRAYRVLQGLANGINGSTTAGRYIRRLMRSQYRALEDTVDVLVELGVTAPPLP